MEFRQKALGKLQSPEELDVPVRFARPQGLLVLVVTIVVMAAGCVWAVTGTVSSKLAAPGVLTHTQGSYLLQSPVPGQVTAVHAKAGQSVEKGAPVVSVRTDQGVRPVRAVARGRVTSLAAEVGAVVTTGADVATVERVRSADDPLVAMLYIPADKGATVPVGATVDLTVGSVPADRYGMLRGTVQSVGQSPQTRQQISGFLGDKDLAQQFTRRWPWPSWCGSSAPRPRSPGTPGPATAARRPPPSRRRRCAARRTSPRSGPSTGSCRDRHAAPAPARRARERPQERAPCGPPPCSRWRPSSAVPPRSPWCWATTGAMCRWRSCASPAAYPGTAPGPAVC